MHSSHSITLLFIVYIVLLATIKSYKKRRAKPESECSYFKYTVPKWHKFENSQFRFKHFFLRIFHRGIYKLEMFNLTFFSGSL